MPFFLGPVIRYLSDNIKQLGGDLHSHNIYCRRCTDRKGGGFDPEYGILICANEMKDQGHLEDTMAHEMVHAYDHLRFKVDWTNNLRHAACTQGKSNFIRVNEERWITYYTAVRNPAVHHNACNPQLHFEYRAQLGTARYHPVTSSPSRWSKYSGIESTYHLQE